MSAVISNTNVNYTNYYNLINGIKDYCAQNPSISQVGNEDLADFDLREFPMYPVVNINILSTRFKQSTTDYEVQLLIADKYKEKNNESNPRTNEQTVPFYGTDDKYDAWANALAVMNDISSFLQRGMTNFEINGNIKALQFHERFDSGLCGWTLNFILTTHNDKNRCLFELYPN